MIRKKNIKIKFTIGFLTAAVLVAMSSCQRGVTLIVHNQTEQPLSRVHIKAADLDIKIPKLLPQQKWQKIVNKPGESSATLIVYDQHDQKIIKQAGYFEKNYKGFLQFNILPDTQNDSLRVKTIDKIELPGILY